MFNSSFFIIFAALVVLAFKAGAIWERRRLGDKLRVSELGGRELAKEVVERIKKEDSLNEISRLRAQFVSSVSHELRSPLTSIRGFARTILSDAGMSEANLREFVSIIDQESQRLSRLVEDLLQLSKIDAGRMELHQEMVSVEDLVESVKQSLQPVMNEHQMELKVIVESGLNIPADFDKLHSVLSNLLGNAVKFSPDGGVISIRAYRGEQFVCLEVSDLGEGMSEYELARVFERFYRVEHPGEEIPGTGLGLAIVKEFVELHHGEVKVKSELGKGSTFTVCLPCGT